MNNEKKKPVKKDEHDAPPYVLREPELTKENCSPELWQQLGGDSIAENKDDDLPF